MQRKTVVKINHNYTKNMATIILIHGAFGNPEENWFPWLKTELESSGHKVIAPTFPTPNNQSLDSWRQAWKNQKIILDQDTIFVGHSLGPVFIFDLLQNQQISNPIKASFLVAPFLSKLKNPDFDPVNKTFIENPINWQTVKQNCEVFKAYVSDNDPYVPMEISKEVTTNLNINPIIVNGAGHFNESAGYAKFPLLLKEILSVLEGSQ